jgi:hypothetical protein
LEICSHTAISTNVLSGTSVQLERELLNHAQPVHTLTITHAFLLAASKNARVAFKMLSVKWLYRLQFFVQQALIVLQAEAGHCSAQQVNFVNLKVAILLFPNVLKARSVRLEQQYLCFVNQRRERCVLPAQVLHWLLLSLLTSVLQALTSDLGDAILALLALSAKVKQPRDSLFSQTLSMVRNALKAITAQRLQQKQLPVRLDVTDQSKRVLLFMIAQFVHSAHLTRKVDSQAAQFVVEELQVQLID